MKEKVITQALLTQVLNMLEVETPFKKENYFVELQDDSLLLFISIPTDTYINIDAKSTFKRVGQLMSQMMPNRANDYSWMVTFTKAGKVVHSYFGGNLNSPNSGL